MNREVSRGEADSWLWSRNQAVDYHAGTKTRTFSERLVGTAYRAKQRKFQRAYTDGIPPLLNQPSRRKGSHLSR